MKTNTPEFVDFYIQQLISEECVIELHELAWKYDKEKKALEERQTNRDGSIKELEILTGKKFQNIGREELKALEAKCKEDAKSIAAKHAKIEGISFKEWKDPEPKISVQEKSRITEQKLADSQDKMEEAKGKGAAPTFDDLSKPDNDPEPTRAENKEVLLKQLQEQWSVNEKEITKKTELQASHEDAKTREQKKIELVESMKKQWGIDQEKIKMPDEANDNKKPNEEQTRDHRREELLAQMRRQDQEKRRERERDR